MTTWHEKNDFGFFLPFRCWESALPQFIFPLHWHECYEIFLVTEGKVDVTIDGHTLEVSDGDIVSINPRQTHSFPQSEIGTRLRFFQFETSIFSQDLGVAEEAVFSRKPVLRGKGCPERDALDEVLHARASGFLADIFTEYRERKKGYRLAIKADFYQMALAYFRDGPPDNDSPPLSVMQEVAAFVTDRRLEPIYLLIFKDFDQSDLSLDRAACAAALSPFYVARLFKEQTGQSFYDYLTTVRVSYAMEYLLTTDLPVSLIADKCGFASQPTFHRVFKAKTGCSPVKYRRETKKQ